MNLSLDTYFSTNIKHSIEYNFASKGLEYAKKMCDVICKTVLCVFNLFFTNLKREKNLFQIEDFHTIHCMNDNFFHSIYKKRFLLTYFRFLEE